VACIAHKANRARLRRFWLGSLWQWLGRLPVHARQRLLASSAADIRAMAVGFHSRGELPAFDDIDHLVLARLTLKGALLNRVHPAQVE